MGNSYLTIVSASTSGIHSKFQAKIAKRVVDRIKMNSQAASPSLNGITRTRAMERRRRPLSRDVCLS
jgi:hypothetical protein